MRLVTDTPPPAVAAARCGATTTTFDGVDGRWHAATAEEQTLLAHFRGWAHHGPTCLACAETRRAVAHATGQEVPSWAS
jgi:hypothetical protein